MNDSKTIADLISYNYQQAEYFQGLVYFRFKSKLRNDKNASQRQSIQRFKVFLNFKWNVNVAIISTYCVETVIYIKNCERSTGYTTEYFNEKTSTSVSLWKTSFTMGSNKFSWMQRNDVTGIK